MNHTRTHLLLAIVLVAGAAHAAKAQVGMPAGARRWTEFSTGRINFGWTGDAPNPSPNYLAAFPPPDLVRVNADATANTMRVSFCTNNSNVFLRHSMVDRYTIVGPPGTQGQPVTARLVMHGVGKVYLNFFSSYYNAYYGLSSIRMAVGSWNPTTDPLFNEQFRVDPFTGYSTGGDVRFSSPPFSPTQPIVNVDVTLDRELTRTVGEPFDLAYELDGQGSGVGNLSGSASPRPDEYFTATIDWILPQGYTMTSEGGWSSPNGPAPCTGDFNQDGGVDGADVSDFFAAWESGGAASDLNQDGGVDGDDVITFFDHWQGGC